MQVTIFGCGPSGLAAAHAAKMAGHEVTILSQKRKSEMYGAQYLHAPIPGMTDHGPVQVVVDLFGSHNEYREKVYGTEHKAKVASVSTEDLPPVHSAWNIRQTYEAMWNAYEDLILDQRITPEILDAAGAQFQQSGRLLISTIPAKALCRQQRHVFHGQSVWALGDAPERGVFVRDVVQGLGLSRNHIICNGLAVPNWYRASNVFDRRTVEWSFDYDGTGNSNARPPVKGASLLTKPIRTDCDCWPGVVRLGRYGAWRKGVLVHDVFTQTLEMLDGAA